MYSQKKLNTYGVESPYERLPGVGSSLANPGLSKVQRLQRCVVSTFIMRGNFIGNLPRYRWRCVLTRFLFAHNLYFVDILYNLYHLFICF